MHLAKAFANPWRGHHAAIDPTQELFKIVKAAIVDFTQQIFIADQTRVEHQTNIGQVILIVFGQPMITRPIQFAILAFKGSAVKIITQDGVHGAINAFKRARSIT